MPTGTVELVSRQELARYPHWQAAFAENRKDHRFYELVEDTIQPEFDYRYLVLKDDKGDVVAIQPCFILQQDILAGFPGWIHRVLVAVRRVWPRFLTLRTLMIGCAAGEAHLDRKDDADGRGQADWLSGSIVETARRLGVSLVVLKEFPAKYRGALKSFVDQGFTCVPSLPMVKAEIGGYANFEDYMRRQVSAATRSKLRRKFKATARKAALDLQVVHDISPDLDEAYPLYLAVYERSQLRFEKLTPAFFARLGAAMPDKTRFLVWRDAGKIVAFHLIMVHGDACYSEYVGLDYAVAFALNLYYVVVRDTAAWAMANGYQHYRGSGLNYEPKYHLRFLLDPIDLYVRHTSDVFNLVLRRVLPLIEPTRHDPMLKRFANYSELRSGGALPSAIDGTKEPM